MAVLTPKSGISKLLHLIFINCLEIELLPREWKKANIVPAHKKVINNNKLWTSIGPVYLWKIFLSTVTNPDLDLVIRVHINSFQ